MDSSTVMSYSCSQNLIQHGKPGQDSKNRSSVPSIFSSIRLKAVAKADIITGHKRRDQLSPNFNEIYGELRPYTEKRGSLSSPSFC